MPTRPTRSHQQAIQETCFARAFPELAGASTTQIRESMAIARAGVRAQLQAQRDKEALERFRREQLVPLPGM